MKVPIVVLTLFLSHIQYKLTVVGVNGANGVSVLRQSVAFKQGQENVLIQNQHMVGNTAMEPEQS